MKILTLFFTLVSLALAASRTNAPPGALAVGRRQKYTTISQAVAALSNTTTSEQVVFIHPGTYVEQVYIPKLSGPLTVFGYTKDDSKYAANQVTIVASESQKTQPNNDLTATLRVWTSDFKLYNVNVKNAFGEGSQAVAVSAQADVSYHLSLPHADTLSIPPTFPLLSNPQANFNVLSSPGRNKPTTPAP
jgi:pectinesterase